jgi:hypothetical protein
LHPKQVQDPFVTFYSSVPEARQFAKYFRPATQLWLFFVRGSLVVVVVLVHFDEATFLWTLLLLTYFDGAFGLGVAL